MYSGQIDETLHYADLFELYVFADKVDVPAMKKGIMTFIHKHSNRRGSPAIEDAVKAFSVLPESAYHEHESVDGWRSKCSALQLNRTFADMTGRLRWR